MKTIAVGRRDNVARSPQWLTRDLAQFKPPPERDVGHRVDDQTVAVVLAEYSAIRQEIQTALSNQQSTLSVGAATLGLLAAVGARFWPKDLVLGGLVFSLAVPAACAMALRMWYGELLRVARAAFFTAELERWITQAMGGTRLLLWEQWMGASREQGHDIDRATWRSVVLGLGSLAVMSLGLGMYWLVQAHGLRVAAAIAITDLLLLTREWCELRVLRRRACMYFHLTHHSPKSSGQDIRRTTCPDPLQADLVANAVTSEAPDGATKERSGHPEIE
jgi:hypothetical protein